MARVSAQSLLDGFMAVDEEPLIDLPPVEDATEHAAMIEAAIEALDTKDISLEALVGQLEDADASLLWDPRIWAAAGQGRSEHEYKVRAIRLPACMFTPWEARGFKL